MQTIKIQGIENAKKKKSRENKQNSSKLPVSRLIPREVEIFTAKKWEYLSS